MENMRRFFSTNKAQIELSDISNVSIPLLSSRYTKTNHITAKSYGRAPARSVSQLFCFNQQGASDDFTFEDFSEENRYTPYSLPKNVANAWIGMAPSTADTKTKRAKEIEKSNLREQLKVARTSSVLDIYATSKTNDSTSYPRDGSQGGFGADGHAKQHRTRRTSTTQQHVQQQESKRQKEHKHNQRFRIHRRKMSSIQEQHNSWQSAVDPKSGRTYYFNTITRETQWRMPMKLASESERAIMEAKERKQKDFFACMEANILRNFASGTIGTPKQGELKKDPSAKKEMLKRPNMVRTISSMDEFVLKEIVQTRQSEKSRLGSLALSSLQKGDAQLNFLEPLQESMREEYSFEASSQGIDFQNSFGQGSMAFGEESYFGEESSSDGFGLSLTELNALQELAKVSEQMLHLNDSSFGASSAAFDFDPAEADQEGENFRATLSKPAKPLGKIAPIKEEEEEETVSPPALLPRPVPLGIIKPLTRRNTCGTIYVKSTMSQPDKDATIKCVCGVFRAHIVASAKEEELNGGYDPIKDLQRVFNDRESQRTSTPNVDDGLSVDELKLDEFERNVPHLDEITIFYRDVFRRAQMESDCIIMSLIYVERLIKDSDGQLRPRKSNWRSLLFAAMVLSSKVWDDLSMWNADFSQACPAGVAFSLHRINELELKVLNVLNYKVKVPASEYAKYYFLLRSMLIKSGLGGDDMFSDMPLDIEGAKKLQQVTASFQSAAKRRVEAANALRSKSMGDADKMLLMAGAQRHAQGAKLEHMVQM